MCFVLTSSTASVVTINMAFSELGCPAGTILDLKQIGAVWVFVKAGTFTIDQVRRSNSASGAIGSGVAAARVVGARVGRWVVVR